MTKQANPARTQRRAEQRASAKRVAMGTGSVLALGAGLVTASATPAGAATFIVTNNADDGPGSLRVAIEDANFSAGTDIITFTGVTGEIVLTTGEITISESLVIDGPGASALSINGNDNSRIFYVSAGDQSVSIDGLTFSDGTANGGGAIRSRADLTLTDTAFSGNDSSGFGGGVAVYGADASISDSTFYNNDAYDSGGGLAVLDSSSVSITETNFIYNEAEAAYSLGGGGVYLYGVGDATISASRFRSNQSENQGGGLASHGGNGPITITGTTFEDNDSDTDGGGAWISDNGAAITITGSYFEDNYTTTDGGGLMIENSDGPVAISTTDFADNDASSDAGGLAINGHDNTATITDTTITGNEAPNDQAGGVWFNSPGATASLTITTSTITDNTANYGGGVTFSGGDTGATLRIVDTTIADNDVNSNYYGDGGRGGGLYSTNAGAIEIVRSTISGNTAEAEGGGIFFYYSESLTIETSTISGNEADEEGGGIFHRGDVLNISHSTITDNTSGEDGGGLYLVSDAVVDHTIIAGNTADSGGDDLSGDGEIALTNSIIGDATDTPGISISDDGNNQLDVIPALDPLADNGGPTETHALPEGSVARETGDPAFASPPDTDQRGEARVGFDVIDVGAYEAQPDPTTPTTAPTTDPDDGVDPTTATPGTSPAATPTTANPTFTG